MLQILEGDCISVLKGMEKESVNTVYMCPSPFGFYEDNPEKIGGEPSITKYVSNLIDICNACRPILKKSGNLFIQIPDVYTPFGNLASIPSFFEIQMILHGCWELNDRIIWHRTEKNNKKRVPEAGFLKNYEYIFHFVLDQDHFYFNSGSKYAKTSVFSYPLEDTYFTNEFDSGLPTELSKIVIDTTTKEGDTVLDPLCGSAKLGVVAKKMNRNFIGIEIDHQTYELCKIRLGLNK